MKTSYGFKLKQYAPRLLDKVTHKAAGINDIILGRAELPMPETVTEKNMRQIRAARKLIRRKQRQYETQNLQFAEMREDAGLKEYLDRTKTAAVYHRAKYLLKFRKAKNVIILAPAIATNMTWIPFLTINKERFRTIQTAGDLNNIPEGTFLVVSTSMLRKLKRGLMRFVKRTSGKLCLVFDESDEITNPTSQRTRNILCIFRRLRYKILDTGTTTRNNIAELYSQFELLYNNSVNMICWSPQVYHENRDHEIEEENNPDYGTPFPAFRGHVLFRACHCPGKATVFGIEKQNQDVYNKDELSELIGKTVITRKFRDFAGEKYRIRTHTVRPSEGEHEVYRVIIEEFCRICELYYNSTGDTKKDAGLRLMRQIKLLIKACSVPHLIEGYYGDSYPSKTRYIERLIRTIPGKVAIGCTTLAAFDLYESYIRGQTCICGQGRCSLQETTEHRDRIRLHHQRHPDMHTAEPEQLREHTYLQRRDTGIPAVEHPPYGTVLLPFHPSRFQRNEGCPLRHLRRFGRTEPDGTGTDQGASERIHQDR